VCTRPSHRGRGLAAALVRAFVATIHARGERAFLQAKADNHAAIRLYESLGFTVAGSGTVEAVILRAPS
jgi:predicted GNAT family acetyltransferase